MAAALVLDEDSFDLPSRVHAIVLISQLHKPAARALAYARATRPSILEAVTVQSDDTPRLQKEWDKQSMPVPLKVLASPYREVTRPIINYIKNIRRDNPREVITIYIPEYVVGHWWEHLLHN